VAISRDPESGEPRYTTIDRWEDLNGHVRVESHPSTHRDVAQATMKGKIRG